MHNLPKGYRVQSAVCDGDKFAFVGPEGVQSTPYASKAEAILMAWVDADRYTNHGHLQHGTAGEPMRTERVRVRNEYGDRWLAYFEGVWRRVHIQVKRTFIVYRGERITIKIDGV